MDSPKRTAKGRDDSGQEEDLMMDDVVGGLSRNNLASKFKKAQKRNYEESTAGMGGLSGDSDIGGEDYENASLDSDDDLKELSNKKKIKNPTMRSSDDPAAAKRGGRGRPKKA
jgi:hypothetical protein